MIKVRALRARGCVCAAVLVACCVATPAAGAATGELAFQEVQSGQAGLTGARGVAVSPDGRSVYVAGQDADAIVTYSRSASGALTNTGCIKDSGSLTSCAASAEGLDSARFIAVSPDNRNVYVSGGGDRAVAVFNRDESTGALTSAGCWKDTTSTASCTNTTAGLFGAEGIVVSPDGANVYVAGQDQDTLVTFSRSASSGDLSAPTCVEQAGSPASCPASTTGLDAPRELAISPDGKGVYVAAATSNAIAAFLRSPGDGALTPAGTGTGVALPVGVAVSPDSSHVYAGGVTSKAVRVFTRDKATSALTAGDCVKDVGSSATCGATAEGLSGVEGVAVSPDGASVYGAGATDNAIVALARDAASGALSPVGCLRDAPGGAGCGTADGLGSAHGVAVSPDGRSVYVTGFSDAALTVLRREAPVGPSPPGPKPVPPEEEPGDPPPANPSGPATKITLLLGGRTIVVAGGVRGVQVRTDGTCTADLFETDGQTLKPESQPLFKRASLAIRRAGTYVLPLTLTARGKQAVARTGKTVAVRSALSCASQRYPSSDLAGFGTGTPTAVTPKPDPGVRKPVQIGLIDPSSDPGAVPPDQEFRVRWKAAPPPGGGPTVTFDVVDDKRVENFQVTGGLASCFGDGGAASATKADFTQFKTESVPIDRNGQADLFKRLAVPGDAIRQAQLHINFNELSVGKDNAGGVLKFDFRAGSGGCGLLVTFTAKPERIEVPTAQRVEYGGRTERGGEVTFNLAGGKRIDDLRIEVPVQCGSSSDIFGTRSFELVELFTADTIAIKDGAFNVKSRGPSDFLTLFGTIANGRVEGHVLAGRTLANGTTDFIACGSTQELAFSARPGKPEAKGDRDADGVPDDRDKCPTISDAGDQRRLRDGCPAGSGTSGALSPVELLASCPKGKASSAGARAARQLTDAECAEQRVVESYQSYASALTDHAVETFRLGFVETTVPALAADEDRGALGAYARDVYAAIRLPLRNIVRQSIVITTPPDIASVSKALITSKDHLGQREPSAIDPPDCTKFRPGELVLACKTAYRDLVQTVCDSALELYRIKWDLTKKRLLPGIDWTTPSGRFGPVGENERCNIPPVT